MAVRSDMAASRGDTPSGRADATGGDVARPPAGTVPPLTHWSLSDAVQRRARGDFQWGEVERFDVDNYRGNVFEEAFGNRGVLTFSHVEANCYSGGCARFDIQPSYARQADSGTIFHFTKSQRVNVGYMIYFGRDWASAMGRTGNKHVLIYDDISTSGGRNIRPMVTESAVHDYRTFSSCNNAAGVCGDEFGHHFATDYPNRHSFQIESFQEQWLYVEFEVVIGGNNTLYVFSRDGRLAHRIGQINSINIPSQPLWYVRILAYFGDRVAAGPTTSQSYVLIDNVVVNNHFMGPPQGFIVGSP